MPSPFILKGSGGGRRTLAEGTPDLDAFTAAQRTSADRRCRVLLTRDGITLAAFDSGRMIDPSMADFPEARPATRPAPPQTRREN